MLRSIMELLEKKLIRPVVDRIFPTWEIREALTRVKEGHSRGKVIVLIRTEGVLSSPSEFDFNCFEES